MFAASGSPGGFLLWHRDDGAAHRDGMGGERSVDLGELLRPVRCWGDFLFFSHPQQDRAYTERSGVGMVVHGMALGEELLSRSVLPPLKRNTPGAGD